MCNIHDTIIYQTVNVGLRYYEYNYFLQYRRSANQ